MEAKEKALYLIEKFKSISGAIACVEQVLTSEEEAYPGQYVEVGQVFKKFWNDVLLAIAEFKTTSTEVSTPPGRVSSHKKDRLE